jgi:hypothetical protein
MNDLPELPSAYADYAESTPFIRAAETGGALMPIPDDPGVDRQGCPHITQVARKLVALGSQRRRRNCDCAHPPREVYARRMKTFAVSRSWHPRSVK